MHIFHRLSHQTLIQIEIHVVVTCLKIWVTSIHNDSTVPKSVEVRLHEFFVSGFCGCEWTVSLSGISTLCTQFIGGWTGHSRCGHSGGRKTSLPLTGTQSRSLFYSLISFSSNFFFHRYSWIPQCTTPVLLLSCKIVLRPFFGTVNNGQLRGDKLRWAYV
jgi:hypothetical protein